MFCLDLWFPLDCIRRKVVWCTTYFCLLLLVFLLFAVFPFDVCALLCAYRQSIQFLRMADSLCLFVHIKTIYRFSFWVSPKKMMDEVNPFFLYYCNEISCKCVTKEDRTTTRPSTDIEEMLCRWKRAKLSFRKWEMCLRAIVVGSQDLIVIGIRVHCVNVSCVLRGSRSFSFVGKEKN